MADLSQIRLNGTTYAFKDTFARNALANINPFSIEIVSSLPNSNIDTHTFYLISNGGTGQNVYDEYLYVNGNWEKLGSVNAGSIDMTGYLKTTDIAAWAKKSSKPSYTAAEVGAVSTSAPAAAITASDISSWNNKSDFSGSYNDLTNKPTIPAAYDDSALAARVTALENTEWYRYYSGTANPDNSMGNNGDLYFQTLE